MAGFQTIVVMPVGPNSRPEHARDTAESVARHMPGSLTIVVDTTEGGLPPRLFEGLPAEIARYGRERGRTIFGQVYFACTREMKRVLRRYDFDVILRLDDDALVIAPGADDQAAAYFREHPKVGCLGSYRTTCMGARRDFSSAARILARETGWRGIKRPRRWRRLREAVRMARRHGYEAGEHALASAVFFSSACVASMASAGLLADPALVQTNLGDDHVLGLAVRAAGFAIADFATDGYPLGLAWQGLPAPPAQLVRMGKAIVHSVKGGADLTQDQLRAAFRTMAQE